MMMDKITFEKRRVHRGPRITWKPSGEVHRTGSRAATHLRQRAAVQQVIRAVNVWLYSKEEVGR